MTQLGRKRSRLPPTFSPRSSNDPAACPDVKEKVLDDNPDAKLSIFQQQQFLRIATAWRLKDAARVWKPKQEKKPGFAGFNKITKPSTGSGNSMRSFSNGYRVPNEYNDFELNVPQRQSVANLRNPVKTSSSDVMLGDPQCCASEKVRSHRPRSKSAPAISMQMNPTNFMNFNSIEESKYALICERTCLVRSSRRTMPEPLQWNFSSVLRANHNGQYGESCAAPVSSTNSFSSNSSSTQILQPMVRIHSAKQLRTGCSVDTPQPRRCSSAPLQRKKSYEGALDVPAVCHGDISPTALHVNTHNSARSHLRQSPTGEARSRPKRSFRFPYAKEIFDLLDNNGNGVLEKSEWVLFNAMVYTLAPELAYTLPSCGFTKRAAEWINEQEWIGYIESIVKNVGLEVWKAAARKVAITLRAAKA
eukprot:gnl/MRDRNA2_/MRDRNA2_222052_c0_seq1.p1 gnl/MRDRNA2_/MRDRNA2_222052_c0~~gnl/MRDRNA2_/MRDRNA2_222052_c0_seq1.p1  ORF type:complete len:418 (+),score=41.91 gnl/MRDRNA2_/MRDRNA2_222052_c0_seq1:99-1352(+)